MLSSSDCESLAVADLLALEPDARERLLSLQLGYTEVPGSAELRDAIAAGYERVTAADVLAVAAPLRGRLGARLGGARSCAAARHAPAVHQQPAQPDRPGDAPGGVRAGPRARARALAGAVQRRGLQGSRARPSRPPAGCGRRVRARDLAGGGVEGPRPAGPARRVARRARADAARAGQGHEALHDDLLAGAE